MSQVACGTGAPTIPDELLDFGSGGSNGEDYPAGPYGAEVGQTIEDFSFSGYRSPHQERNLEEIRFSDFYDPEGEKGVQLLLLNTAAAWCQPCAIEHSDLPEKVEAYADDGLVVFSMLFQDPNGAPASEETLGVWTTTFSTNFPMVLDPSYQMGRYGAAETPPLNLVVDPQNMQLLKVFVGNQEGPMWEYIERELRERAQQ